MTETHAGSVQRFSDKLSVSREFYVHRCGYVPAGNVNVFEHKAHRTFFTEVFHRTQ
jgi:hypothetical protein